MERMSEKLKNYLGLALIVASLAFAYAVVGFVVTRPDYSERTFSVSGEGEVVAIPDVGNFTFSILSEGGINLAELQEANTQKSNQVIGFLKQEGVEEKDIQSQNYQITPRYQYYDCFERGTGVCPPPEIVGYTIEHTVSVKVKDLQKAGNLISGTVSQGANTVSQLSFSVDDPTEILNEARAEAIGKAKEQAKTIAHTSGFRLGKLISLYFAEQPSSPAYYDYALSGKGGGEEAAPIAPSIEPGSQKVVANVTLTYEIR